MWKWSFYRLVGLERFQYTLKMLYGMREYGQDNINKYYMSTRGIMRSGFSSSFKLLKSSGSFLAGVSNCSEITRKAFHGSGS